MDGIVEEIALVTTVAQNQDAESSNKTKLRRKSSDIQKRREKGGVFVR